MFKMIESFNEFRNVLFPNKHFLLDQRNLSETYFRKILYLEGFLSTLKVIFFAKAEKLDIGYHFSAAAAIYRFSTTD